MNPKIKWVFILLVTIILLYLLHRYYRKQEKFDNPFPAETLANQELLDEGNHIGIVYLEFIYKVNPECSITREFLSGCCQPITNTKFEGDYLNRDTSKVLVGSNNTKYNNIANKDLSKLFSEVLDRDHEFYKKYIKEEPKDLNLVTDMFDALSSKYFNTSDPIFNKRAMNICHVQELYGLTFQLGILFYKVVNFDQEKL